MSNDRAIAAVTATLKTMIFSAVSADATLAGSQVTARPPDRARQGVPANQVNLFLYRTSLDAAFRNQDPASIRPGELGQPPLPLVLSYLITAYGDSDDEVLSHRLLGLAMSVLHDRPLLSRAGIAAALAGSDLENQIERVRITPHPIPLDEISRMWATFGTGYRISVSYDAAVVLIDSTRAVSAPLPVLRRGADDTGPAALAQLLPQVDYILPPNGQPAARPGDTITLVGRNLAGVTQVSIDGIRLAQPSLVAPTTVSSTTVVIDSLPPLPAGAVNLTALVADVSAKLIPSNTAPLGLAPAIVSTAALTASLTDGATSLEVTCAPAVEPGQSVALLVGDRVVTSPVGAPGTPARTQLAFDLTGFTAGTYTLRLRVDGHDSIPVATPLSPADLLAPAPMFVDPDQTLVLT